MSCLQCPYYLAVKYETINNDNCWNHEFAYSNSETKKVFSEYRVQKPVLMSSVKEMRFVKSEGIQ